MFPGAFKRRWTLRWAVGRIITALIFALVFLFADYARAYDPRDSSYDEDNRVFNVESFETESEAYNACTASGGGCRIERFSRQPPVGIVYRFEDASGGNREDPAGSGNYVSFANGTYYIFEYGETSCEAGREVSAALNFGPSEVNDDGTIAIDEEYTDVDGCLWELAPDVVNACLVGTRDDGKPGSQCSVTYRNTGNKEETGIPEPQAEEFESAGAPSIAEEVVEETTETPPQTTEFSDGSSKTVQERLRTWTGGGRASVSHAEGSDNWTMSVVESSLTTETVTTTTYNSADGSRTVTRTTKTSWNNGDAATIALNRSGDGSGTVTVGGSGGGESTTVTTIGADGSTTTKTTTSGNGAGGSNCGPNGCTGTDAPDSPGGSGDSGAGGDGEGEGEGGEGEQPGDAAGPDTEGAEEIGESLGRLYDGVWDTPLVSSFDGIAASFPSGGACPAGSFDVFGHTVAFDGHCTLFEKVRGILAAGMRAFWVILAVALFLTL